MLGFSDGTKDGGYLMAQGFLGAKEALTEISREFGIKVIFFDGRGGTPHEEEEKQVSFMPLWAQLLRIKRFS